MCGISGIFHRDGKQVNVDNLLAMTKIIQHRGPDDEGYLLINTQSDVITHAHHNHSIEEIKQNTVRLKNSIEGNLGIGFRRLSIIDLSAKGHQPMCNQDKSIWLTMNGEIYNYVEIKQELQQRGISFYTASDTEVLIQAYMVWGVSCLQKLNGMFAFVIWDARKKTIFAARDRMGKKPFNYYLDKNKFIWASEEKQILASQEIQSTANEIAIGNFLVHNQSYVADETFITDIKQLPSGHYLTINSTEFNTHSYWTPKITGNPMEHTFEEWKDGVKEKLSRSIQIRLRSDVSLGIALSGGIDSSSISCLARGLTPNKIKTFSVFYPGTKFDEREYIQEVLKKGNFDPQFYTTDAKVNIDSISKFIFHQDGPVTSASPFSAFQNYYNVHNAGIVVLLNGQGGDELFAGYPYYYKYYFNSLIKNGQWIRALKEFTALINQQDFIHASKHVLFAKYLLIADKQHALALEQSKFRTNDLYPLYNGLRFPYIHQDNESNSALQNMLWYSLRVSHMPHMLHWEDRNSMAHSIESRVPFLDYQMVEYAFTIPDAYKIQAAQTKYILREAMRGIVPDKVLNRKDKIGFGTPTDAWMTGILKQDVSDILHTTTFQDRPYWNGKQITETFDKDPESFKQHELWKIITTELWLRNIKL